MEMMLNRLDLRYLSVFLWAGLNWEDPLLHLVKVENILVQYKKDSDKLKEIEKAVVKALKNAVKSIGQQSENWEIRGRVSTFNISHKIAHIRGHILTSYISVRVTQ